MKTKSNKYRIGLLASLLTFTIFSMNAFRANAQEADTTYWKKGFTGSLTFTQSSFTNWTGGGVNSIALNAFASMFADYNKDRTSWENSLDMGYGIIDQEGTGFRKSDDRLVLTSKYGYKLKEKLYWSTMIDFRTQFADGFVYDSDGNATKISSFMAPAYLLLSTGLDWKPNDYFSLYYSPVTGKFTFVNDESLFDPESGAFGVEPGKTSRAELGTFLKANFKKEIFKNVNYESKLELFSGYDENFGNIDVNWENLLLMKVNSWLSASLVTQLLYDDDIDYIEENELGEEVSVGPKVQFKQIFGLGLSYSVGDKKKK